MNTSQKLKELRNKIKLTQKEFSDKFSIPKSTYEHWEMGTRKPPKYVVIMIEHIIALEEKNE